MKHYILIKDKEVVDNSKHMRSLKTDHVIERMKFKSYLYVYIQATPTLCTVPDFPSLFYFAVFVITIIF